MARTKLRTIDRVHAFRTIYGLQEENCWLSSVHALVRDALPEGPLVSYTYRLAHHTPQMGCFCADNDESENIIMAGFRHLASPGLANLYRRSISGCAEPTLAQYGVAWPNVLRREWGVRDLFGIMAGSTDGRGVYIGLGLDRQWRTRPGMMAAWNGFAHHLATAHRARRQLAQTLGSGATSESTSAVFANATAVFDETGQCTAAQEEAADDRALRQRLRDLVRRRQREVDTLRRDPAYEPEALWSSTFTGEWLVLDYHEANGRSYWVVVPNANPDHQAILTERDVTMLRYALAGRTKKWIAQHLGMREPNVSARLKTVVENVFALHNISPSGVPHIGPSDRPITRARLLALMEIVYGRRLPRAKRRTTAERTPSS